MKKGQYEIGKKMVMILPLLFIITFIAIYLYSFFGQFEKVTFANIDDIEDHVLINRLISSDSCFAYVNNGRVDIGIIDLSKFNNDRLKECLFFGENPAKFIEVNLNFLDNGKNKIISNGKFDGRANLFTKYVVVYDDGELKRGILSVKISRG